MDYPVDEEEESDELLFARLRYADPRFFTYQLPLNGFIAVLLSKTATVPLEFLNPQIPFRRVPSTISTILFTPKGRVVFKNHFLKGILRWSPQCAIQFTIYENFKLFLTSPQGINGKQKSPI
jgi:hypothetical protein